jgi:uncharacterized membrane protein
LIDGAQQYENRSRRRVITKTAMDDQSSYRLVIRRNCSLTWGQTKLAICVIALGPLSVALVLAVAGFWPVLPFAGLEMLVVAWCFYHCARSARECEVVTVRDGEIVVEKGQRRPEREWSFNRHWATVALDRPVGTWHPSRLSIRSHGRTVEIGRFLAEQERVALALELRKFLSSRASSAQRPTY